MKKVLIMMMCVIMVVCFMPTVAMAEVDNTSNTVTTAEEFRAAITAGGTVVLGGNIDVGTTVSVNNTVTVDLNGYTLSAPSDTAGDGIFMVVSGGNLTIKDSKGSGTVNGVGNNNWNMVVWANGGNVIIEGGTFTNVGATDGKGGTHFDVIYSSGGGNVEIKGGTFEGQTPKWTLNLKDYSDGKFVVKGGRFKNYNPATSETEPGVEYINFVAEGYRSVLNGEYYEVSPIPAPPIYVPTTPTDNVTNSGTSGTDNATTSADLSGSTSTSNGTTTATVDKTTADKIVDKAVENKSEEIVIDATANSTTAASSTTTAQVTIPTDTLGAIAEKTEADVTIKTDVAEVKMDNAAAAAVSEQAEGDTVQIIAEKVKEDATEVHFELKVVCSDGKVISDFKGGNVAVTVALPKSMADKKVVCVYIDDNGHMSKMEGQKNADGTYTFNTGHFSSYAIMAEEEADAAIAAQKEAIKNIKIKLTSKQVKTKAGKKAVKITWTADAGDKVLDGVEVFRSTERYKGYGAEPFYTSTKRGNKGSYTNTKSLKKGTKYYYRVRGYVLVDGQKVYTDYSTKAWRTVK